MLPWWRLGSVRIHRAEGDDGWMDRWMDKLMKRMVRKTKESVLPSWEPLFGEKYRHLSYLFRFHLKVPRLNVSMHGALEKEERLPRPLIDAKSSGASLCLFPLLLSVSLSPLLA